MRGSCKVLAARHQALRSTAWADALERLDMEAPTLAGSGEQLWPVAGLWLCIVAAFLLAVQRVMRIPTVTSLHVE